MHHWRRRSFAKKFYENGIESIFQLLVTYASNNFEEKGGKLEKVVSNVSESSNNNDGLNSLCNITRERLASETDELSQQTKNKILKKRVLDLLV